jgi:hypothetical protein
MLYRSLLRPLLFRLPAETAHELALHSLSIAPTLTKTLLGDHFKRSPFGKLRRLAERFPIQLVLPPALTRMESRSSPSPLSGSASLRLAQLHIVRNRVTNGLAFSDFPWIKL